MESPAESHHRRRPMASDEEIIAAVIAMRQAQRRYFKERRRRDLIEARRLEEMVDRMLGLNDSDPETPMIS
jgi:hypothetical protein